MTSLRTIAIAVGLFAASAFAADLPTFTQLDTDGDGSLTQTELEVMEQFQGEDSEFTEADKNEDGIVDADEYQAWADEEIADANASPATKKTMTN